MGTQHEDEVTITLCCEMYVHIVLNDPVKQRITMETVTNYYEPKYLTKSE